MKVVTFVTNTQLLFNLQACFIVVGQGMKTLIEAEKDCIFFCWTEFFFHPSQSVYFVFQNSQRYRHREQGQRKAWRIPSPKN